MNDDRIRRWTPGERISRAGSHGRTGDGSSPGAPSSGEPVPGGAGPGARGSSSGSHRSRATGASAFPGIEGMRRVTWAELPLGSVIVDGPLVSGSLPPELRDFPLVDAQLRSFLHRKYHFRADHLVTVADAYDPAAADRLAREVHEIDRRLRAGEPLRRSTAEQWRRWGIDPLHERAHESDRLTRSDRLVKDQYNSFTVNTARPGAVPSLLAGPATDLSLANIVTGLLEGRRYLPADSPLTLHLALDVSFSMKDRGRLTHGHAAVNQLAKQIPQVMPGTRTRGYQFSDAVRVVDLPLAGSRLPNEGTRQAPLMRAVLRRLDSKTRNKLVVITDGEPSDIPETLRLAEQAREAKLDYLQILLHTDADLAHAVESRPGEFLVRDNMIDGTVPDERIISLTPEEVTAKVERRFDAFTRIAEVAGGNQVVLTEFSALGLVTVELYDRYVGLLTFVG